MDNVIYKIITFISVTDTHQEYHYHYWHNNMNRTVPQYELYLNK